MTVHQDLHSYSGIQWPHVKNVDTAQNAGSRDRSAPTAKPSKSGLEAPAVALLTSIAGGALRPHYW